MDKHAFFDAHLIDHFFFFYLRVIKVFEHEF